MGCRWIQAYLAGSRRDSCWESDILADGILEVDGPPTDGRTAYEPHEFYPNSESDEDDQDDVEDYLRTRKKRRDRAALDLSAGRRCFP